VRTMAYKVLITYYSTFRSVCTVACWDILRKSLTNIECRSQN